MARFPRFESGRHFSSASIESGKSDHAGPTADEPPSVFFSQGDEFQSGSDLPKIQRRIEVELAHAKAAHEHRSVSSRLQDLVLSLAAHSNSAEKKRLRDASAIATDVEINHFENLVKYPLTERHSTEAKAFLRLHQLTSSSFSLEICRKNRDTMACLSFERLDTEIVIQSVLDGPDRIMNSVLFYNLAKTALSEGRGLRVLTCAPASLGELKRLGFGDDPQGDEHTIRYLDGASREMRTIRTTLELVADPKTVIATYLKDPKWTVSSQRA